MDRTDDGQPLGLADDEGRQTYLARCQVDTPERLVRFLWDQVNSRRPNAGEVVDFGCGDARFSRHGVFDTYTGFEVDPRRGPAKPLARPHRIIFGDAFAFRDDAFRYDVCVGNPPYVRHHDLESDWLHRAEARLSQLLPFEGDGRSNAYVYFLWLALASVKPDGLVALVVPYEWVSRPASEKLRKFIKKRGWDVDVYHIEDAAFERVLTTACVAVIDKRAPQGGLWRYFKFDAHNIVSPVKQLTGTTHRQLEYQSPVGNVRAIRGLSPGGKSIFLLTEGERIRFQLQIHRDVIPAVSSFRHFGQTQNSLTNTLFRNEYVHAGQRCWLLNVTRDISPALNAYLDQVPEAARNNYTCRTRPVWWAFAMPKIAHILYASGFKGVRPKMFHNTIGAVHVGGVHGIHCGSAAVAASVFQSLQKIDLSKKVVALSNNFLKIEVKQMNAVLNDILKRSS
ncbi:Eco57I restriction-modification methylase domain-containing protein [Burkholderia multivorans]|uniref:Eco57I restriction-modification methylase domain-containing protein n=1 Tax=Burkholderia multivorans TaxID=87883 RepID=UPI0015E39475|nr:Eco57I restriction-modification methylase domain-containing protein [Burkholderia multivorans]